MFEEQDFDAIIDRMLSNVSDDLDKREGSVIYDGIAPTALELAEAYIVLDMVMDETFADSASYYYLIKRAAERGLFPKEETYATGKMIVTPADIDIEAGERFNLGELNYAVIEPIEGQEGAYKIQCETAGTQGNQQLGTLLPVEYVEGLETAELTEILVPGEEEEDVETFRERYFASFTDESFGGNKTDYARQVTSIDGVGGCKVIRRWKQGYNPSGFVPADAVTSWIGQQSASTVGQDVYDWLTMVYDAAQNRLLTVGGTVEVIIITSEHKSPSQTLIQTVQQTLDPDPGEGDGLAPVGHVVNVVGAQDYIVDYEFSLTYSSGVIYSDIEAEVNEAIDGYHAQLSQEWSSSEYTVIRISQIQSLLLGITGVEDVSGVKINNEAVNLTLAAEYIPVRGDVTVC